MNEWEARKKREFEKQKQERNIWDSSGNQTAWTAAARSVWRVDLGRKNGSAMGSPEDFDVMKLVGQGGFGKVFLVKRRGEEESVESLLAMKVMDKAQISEGNQEMHIKEELSILAEMDHPFIITLEQAFHTPAKLYLVFEFMPGGDLYITAQGRYDGKYTEEESQFIIAEVTLALGHLHECGIAFRDLKPENVLFDMEGHMRLTDFGLAKRNIATSQRDTACGTPLYMPPEAITNMRDGGACTQSHCCRRRCTVVLK